MLVTETISGTLEGGIRKQVELIPQPLLPSQRLRPIPQCDALSLSVLPAVHFRCALEVLTLSSWQFATDSYKITSCFILSIY